MGGPRDPTLQIRPATAADVPACVAGARVVAATPGGLASLPHEIREDAMARQVEALADGLRGVFLIAECADGIIGHDWLERYALAVTAHVAHLSVAVHEGHQGRGVGRALMEALIAHGTRHPAIEKLELRVRASNTRAIALYTSLGFVVEGVFRRRIRLGDTYVDDVSMARMLDGG